MSLQRQFLRFALVGIAGTGAQYAVLWLGVEVFHASAPLCSAIGYALGSVITYLLNHRFTFRSGQSHSEAAPRFYVVVIVGFCMNAGLMELLVRAWGWNYWLAQVLTTGMVLIWNFTGSRWWAFKPAAT